MDYLKEEQYYIDLYDLFTIKACLNVVKFWQDLYKKKDTDEKLKEISHSTGDLVTENQRKNNRSCQIFYHSLQILGFNCRI